MSGEESGDVRKSETASAGVGAQMPRDGSIPSAARPVFSAVGQGSDDEKPITVRINVYDDIPRGRTLDYGIWETYIYGRLKEAGMPVLPDGNIERGTLIRRDDPTDWGTTIYEWKP